MLGRIKGIHFNYIKIFGLEIKKSLCSKFKIDDDMNFIRKDFNIINSDGCFYE